MPFGIMIAIIVADVVMIIAGMVRYHKMRREDTEHVDAICAYQRGDLDPWDPRFEGQAKRCKRHGYTYDRRYYEDPWEVGVPRD